MKKYLSVKCLNTGSDIEVEAGTQINDIISSFDLKLKYPPIGALVNNTLKETSFVLINDCEIEFIDKTDPNGISMYLRSLIFVLCKAVNDLLKDHKLHVLHAVSKGYYCELRDDDDNNILKPYMIKELKDKMKEIIDEDLPFERFLFRTEDAIDKFIDQGLEDKELILKQRNRIYTSVYKLDGIINYLYGYLVPSTGCLEVFDLVKYFDGMLIQLPTPEEPGKVQKRTDQNKLFDVFTEHRKWVKLLEVENVGKLNQHIIENNAGSLIKIAEALHEKKVSKIADIISERENTRLILISGPSSSGKTTFSKRLAVQLKVSGLKPLIVSLDDYFVNREFTPRDVKGEYDFESLEAIDIELFNQHLLKLFKGEPVEIPKFDFHYGKRLKGNIIKCSEENVIIVEGIHALNPSLTPLVKDALKFRIYVSALTQISIDRHNRISTTDTRLIRRIVRDSKFRNHTALQTLKRWASVRSGEEKNIFPYQENADIMFNSALLYEFSVLKHYAQPVIERVPENTREYAEAKRLLKFLSFFFPVIDEDIPNTSIIKEFIGGSSFKY